MTIIIITNCNKYTKDSFDKNALTQTVSFSHMITIKKR